MCLNLGPLCSQLFFRLNVFSISVLFLPCVSAFVFACYVTALLSTLSKLGGAVMTHSLLLFSFLSLPDFALAIWDDLLFKLVSFLCC